MKLGFLLIFILLVLGIKTGSYYQCLTTTPTNINCFRNVINHTNIKEINHQLAGYLCIILNQNGIKQFNAQQKQKLKDICLFGQSFTKDCGYTLLKMSISENNMVEALKKEYQLFFANSFRHQRQMNHSIVSIKSMLQQNLLQQLPPISKAINLLYLQNQQQSYKILQSIANQTLPIQLQYLKIRLLEKLSRYNQALTYLENLLKDQHNKNNFYLYHLYGNLLMHHLKFSEAIKNFQKSISLQQYPFLFSYYNLALSFQKIGRIKESMIVLQQTVSLSKQPTSELLNTLGFAYYTSWKQTKNNKQYLKLAQKQYRLAINQDKLYYLAYYNLAILKLDQNKYQQAQQMFNLTLKINLKLKSAVYGLFKTKYYKTNTKKVEDLLKIFDLISEKTSIEYLQIGVLLAEIGEYNIAIQYIKQSLILSRNQNALQWKGIILYHLKSFQQAQKSLMQSISLGGRKASVYYNLGLIRKQLKNYQQAIIALQLANKIEPRAQTKEQIDQCKGQLEKIKKLNNEL